MNVTINRLDPNVPDPVESRRRAAGRFVRFAYATFSAAPALSPHRATWFRCLIPCRLTR